jgi:hypothetical protein
MKGLWGEEGYPQDGDGTPPRSDGGAEHSSTGRSARDRDSLIQLQSTDAIIRGSMRMVEGQASDLYMLDTDIWTTTSLVQSSGKEPAASSHSPSGFRSQ